MSKSRNGLSFALATTFGRRIIGTKAMTSKEFGVFMAMERESLGWNIARASFETGTSYYTINAIENGFLPKKRLLTRVCSVYGITAEPHLTVSVGRTKPKKLKRKKGWEMQKKKLKGESNE